MKTTQKMPLGMYVENEPTMKRNEVVLNNLTGELYTTKTNDKIPNNCKYPSAFIQATQNQKQTNTGGLAKLLKLKIGANVILTNIDIQDLLINGHILVILQISHIEVTQESVCKVYVKFSDEQAGLKAMR